MTTGILRVGEHTTIAPQTDEAWARTKRAGRVQRHMEQASPGQGARAPRFAEKWHAACKVWSERRAPAAIS
ncbi:hypothetical protein LMG27952_01357 [Paraburkholderia hiiakae]|uniref:Uncharacterized protein n=1 Tax=Paraburkholderia hiiakae TaxID=1081782 RepID=A0ABM8NEP2_9BURK|nr:hypothetical protein LMG27952_01357 [Paraburkholderia hiiakae]